MEGQEYRSDIRRLVSTLRNVTTAVQILPFVYTPIYIVALALYGHMSDDLQMAVDSLIYVSPVCIVAFLVLSRILRLCVWHRTACAIPAIPLAVNLVDYYVVSFSETFANAFNYMVAGMCVLFLASVYKVFFR